MLYRCIDFETTGIPAENEPHAMVEAAWTDVRTEFGEPGLIMDPHSELVNPGREIPIVAMAVHHIRDCAVAGARTPDQVCADIVAGNADYYVAHKADFEKEFFGGGVVPWICTWKAALRSFPEAPGHKLQELRYLLRFDDDPLFESEFAMPPHRGGPDSYCTAFLLLKLFQRGHTVEEMLKWTKGPALLTICYLNKHRNERWQDVGRTDPSYLRWITEKSDITDRDIRATAKFYLKPENL